MSEQEIQLVVGVITAAFSALLFPFVLYFFKKNERLHEETRNKIGDHSIVLSNHETRILSLEEFKKYQLQGLLKTPTSPVTLSQPVIDPTGVPIP